MCLLYVAVRQEPHNSSRNARQSLRSYPRSSVFCRYRLAEAGVETACAAVQTEAGKIDRLCYVINVKNLPF